MGRTSGGLVVVVVAVMGCSFDLPKAQPIDGDVDAGDSDAVECATWKPHHFDPCRIPAPKQEGLDLSMKGEYTLDTDIMELTPPTGDVIKLGLFSTTIAQADGVDAALISLRSFTVGADAQLRIVGQLPLIVASWGSIAVSGEIDAGSHTTVEDTNVNLITTISAGAGANPGSCGSSAATAGGDADADGGSGGGGGGGFRGAGGTGGKGDSGGQQPGGSGGKAVGAPGIVRGGCPGATSGKAGSSGSVMPPSDDETRTEGGAGGGAIQLTARVALAISGRISAGGAGGGAAQYRSGNGGGGGGAGGFIGLEAPAMTITNGILAANGGGGGASAPFSNRGNAGQDGRVDAMAAAGGQPGTLDMACARPAPNGAAAAILDGESVLASVAVNCGGAGGGGGAGYILVWGTLTKQQNPTISPAELAGPDN